MKNKINISDKDKRTLLLLFSVIILAISYFFVYTKYNEKTKEIREVNINLSVKMNELKNMEAQKDEKLQLCKELELEINNILKEFPADITPEKNIVFINQLEELADMEVSVIGFHEKELYFDLNAQGEVVVTDESLEETSTNSELVATTTIEDNIQGYKSTLSISFITTYAGLEKCIDFINDYDEKMSIEQVNTSYDSSTGNLSGTMDIVVYSVVSDYNSYEDPVIDSIKIGTDNIFGTVE